MAWTIVHQNNCEQGFYDQYNAPELTIPIGTHVVWIQGHSEGDYPRPEMDLKDSQRHSEVYEGRFSASGSYRWARGTYYLVTDKIYVDPGRLVRGSVAYMHVFDGGGGGARCGIVNGDGPWAEPGDIEGAPEDLDTYWGDWKGTYGDDALPNRNWVVMATPAVQPLAGYVRLVMQFNSDTAQAASAAGHWDAITVEQDSENGGGDEIDYDRIEQIFEEVLGRTTWGVLGGTIPGA